MSFIFKILHGISQIMLVYVCLYLRDPPAPENIAGWGRVLRDLCRNIIL